MLIPTLLIIMIVLALIVAGILMVKNRPSNADNIQKVPPQVIHFLDIVYLLKARGLTDDAQILQALLMTWYKDWRINVSLDADGEVAQGQTAYVFFIPIHEQAPFEDESAHLLMRYCEVNKVSAYFYKPQARLEKENAVLAFINDDPFWETVHNETKGMYEEKMATSKADDKTKAQIFEAIFEEVLPRTIEVYVRQGLAPEKMDLSNPDSRATLITEIERQLDRALADIENTAQFSREFLQTLKWDDVMAEVMDASKQNLISLGYLKAHNTFTEDVVTSYGKNLEREMHAFITYLNQFQQSQAKKPLAKTFWDGHLIWASLLGTEEALHEQMLAVDPSFENMTLFPGQYAQGLHNYSKLLIVQNQ